MKTKCTQLTIFSCRGNDDGLFSHICIYASNTTINAHAYKNTCFVRCCSRRNSSQYNRTFKMFSWTGRRIRAHVHQKKNPSSLVKDLLLLFSFLFFFVSLYIMRSIEICQYTTYNTHTHTLYVLRALIFMYIYGILFVSSPFNFFGLPGLNRNGHRRTPYMYILTYIHIYIHIHTHLCIYSYLVCVCVQNRTVASSSLRVASE